MSEAGSSWPTEGAHEPEAPASASQDISWSDSEQSEVGEGPRGRASVLSGGELSLIRARFFPEQGFELMLPGSRDRVAKAPSGWLGVYEESFHAGLRFPLHEFVIVLLGTYCLVPAQLAPNSWRIVMGFLSLCSLHELPSSVRVFRSLFMLKSHPGEKGWWYFSARGGCRLFDGMPTSIHLWKSRYLFVKAEREWGFDPGWGVPRMEENKMPRLSKEEARIRAALIQLEPARFEDLLSEDALHNAGLSSAPPLGKGFNVSRLCFKWLSSSDCSHVPEMMRSTADFAAKMRERAAGGERRKKRKLQSRAGGPPVVVSPGRIPVIEFAPPVIAVSESVVKPLSVPPLREQPLPGDASTSSLPHAGPPASEERDPVPPSSSRPHDAEQETAPPSSQSPGSSRAMSSSFVPPSLAREFFGASRSSAEFAARNLPPLAKRYMDSLTPTGLVDELYLCNFQVSPRGSQDVLADLISPFNMSSFRQNVLLSDRLVKAYVQNASELASLRLKEGQDKALKAAEEKAEQIARGLEQVRRELEQAREELERTRREGNEKIKGLLSDVKKWEERSEATDQQLCAAESEKGALRVELADVKDRLQIECRRGEELMKQLQESMAREGELTGELDRARKEAASAEAKAAKIDADCFERNADAYEKGFRSCRWQVQHRLDKVDLNFLDLGVPAPSSSGTDSGGEGDAVEETSSMLVAATAGKPGSSTAGE